MPVLGLQSGLRSFVFLVILRKEHSVALPGGGFRHAPEHSPLPIGRLRFGDYRVYFNQSWSWLSLHLLKVTLSLANIGPWGTQDVALAGARGGGGGERMMRITGVGRETVLDCGYQRIADADLTFVACIRAC